MTEVTVVRTAVVVDAVDSRDVAVVVTAAATEPKLAGLGCIVVSMKLAVVNFPAVVFAAAVSATVDTTGRDGGDLYPERDSPDDAAGFCVEFFVWFFSLL